MSNDEKKKGLKLYGAPWYITIIVCLLILATMYAGGLGTDMPSTFALMLALGIPLYEIGQRLPIWNKYIGGGILLAFLGMSVIGTYNLIPSEYITSIDNFTGETNFLTFYIVVLITGSVLSLERNILLRSFAGYFPAILGGFVGAILLAIVGGMFFGISPSELITHYALPIMGGGNGGGAIPLSEVYAGITGEGSEVYYSFAIIILTVGNIFAIFGAALLNKLGQAFPKLTGDGKTLIRGTEEKGSSEEEYTPTLADIASGLFLGLGSYTVGLLFSKVLLPEIFGFPIHELAYMVIFVVLLCAFGIIPKNVRMGAKRLQTFFTKHLTLLIMVGVGADLDLNELLSAITVSNIVVSLFIIIGAILGSGIVGYLVGFYPIDTAVTAGLCMANRGGSGDLAVLGAANRMDLIAYAQLSSRLGGAIILVIASVLFSILL
ncbi:2-hydroxycarboxylate transporter family protein [Tetragenococcus halophilus]|uniref:2-hydroxycarboxylate transporter family protein n=1 Tax=Tetragenococcus halophilus TaxID=51669 RepID=UPI001F1FCCD0|nr:2-hydroxycarboxylate transporter family protein [Tetragenococcus halophilus]MCF1684584.1 2-hydroxycarboxylate transporter family protein [Tetragenococcus halophilus]